jgi:glycosyltransferase involved in cell wall biosynthesis
VAAKRILFVLSGWNVHIGGHFLSGIFLARELARRGYDVGVLIHPQKHALPELEESRIYWHYCPYPENQLSAFFFRRTLDILTIAWRYKYDCIVACDFYTALQSWLALLICGIPMIQIQPGGKVPHVPLLRVPGVIVFSKELYDGLILKFKFPKEYIRLSPGRVDFDYFSRSVACANHNLNFNIDGLRLLCVSRLEKQKAGGIENLLKEIQIASARRKIQLAIIGDGDEKEVFVQKAECVEVSSSGRARIWFTGAFRVTPDILRQADMVVGQGRTVVEAIASGVPAAVCGNDGYFGLIASTTYAELAASNFTGRHVNWRGSLSQDGETVKQHAGTDLKAVYELARTDYDSCQGGASLEAAFEELRKRFPTVWAVRWNFLRAYFTHIVEHLGFWLHLS